MVDGNYVIASWHRQPWRKQLNILAAYLYFYNPLRFLYALVRPKSTRWGTDAALQLLGMCGLTHTVRRTLGWALRLVRGNISRRTTPPASRIPMCGPDGRPAGPALPGTPQPRHARLPATLSSGRH